MGVKRKLRVAKGEGRFHREGKLGRRDKVGYRAAWVLCLSVLFHRKTILGCHAPDPDSNKIIGLDGKQDRTGPGHAKQVLQKRKKGIGGREGGEWEEELLTTLSVVLLGLLISFLYLFSVFHSVRLIPFRRVAPVFGGNAWRLFFLRLRFLFFLSRLMSRPSGSGSMQRGAVWYGVVQCGADRKSVV